MERAQVGRARREDAQPELERRGAGDDPARTSNGMAAAGRMAPDPSGRDPQSRYVRAAYPSSFGASTSASTRAMRAERSAIGKSARCVHSKIRYWSAPKTSVA